MVGTGGRTKVMVWAVAVALVCLGWGWASELWAQGPATIKLGAVVSLTGRYAAGGAQVRAGYEFAVEEANRAGGVLIQEFKRPIPLELVLLDDESDPSKTVSRLETLYSAHQVVAYLGGFGSDLHAAAASVAEKNKVPYVGVAFALHKIHQQGFRYLFSPFWKSPDIGTEVFKFLNTMVPQGQRPTRVAIFQEKTDWGIELGNLWKRHAPQSGYQIVAYGEYAVGAKDFSDLILQAKAARAEAVFALPTPPDGMALFKQMKELDFNARFYLFVRAPDPVVWGNNLGKDGDDVVFAPGWHYALRFPGVKELNEKHAQKFGRPADPMVGPAYAAIQVLANALRRAGTLDREKLRTALTTTNLQTVVGRVRFRQDGTGMVPFVFNQWQKGKQELVWPKEFSSSPLVYPAPAWQQR